MVLLRHYLPVRSAVFGCFGLLIYLFTQGHLQALTSEAEKLFPAPLQPESNDRSEHSEASPAPSNEVFPVTVPPAEAGEASEAGEEGEAGEAGEEGEAMGEVEAEIWGEEEEEEEFTPVDVGCSWTLIGSLFFTMVMFYFVNYPDDDIKRYTWSIINTTLPTKAVFEQYFAFCPRCSLLCVCS